MSDVQTAECRCVGKLLYSCVEGQLCVPQLCCLVSPVMILQVIGGVSLIHVRAALWVFLIFSTTQLRERANTVLQHRIRLAGHSSVLVRHSLHTCERDMVNPAIRSAKVTAERCTGVEPTRSCGLESPRRDNYGSPVVPFSPEAIEKAWCRDEPPCAQ